MPVATSAIALQCELLVKTSFRKQKLACKVKPHYNNKVWCVRLGDFCITPVIQGHIFILVFLLSCSASFLSATFLKDK